MTRSPLARACVALRLPAGLYLDRGEHGGTPMKDSAIRASLRQQHVATERLVLALADVLALLDDGEDASDVWPAANAIAERRDLPASMVGALAFAAMLPEEGGVEPDEWGFFCEAAP